MDSLTLSVRKYAPTTQNTLTYYKNTLLYGQATFSVERLINPQYQKYCGVDWTSPSVLAFSYIYKAFSFFPSSLFILPYLLPYRLTRIHSFLSFLLTALILIDYDRPTDRPVTEPCRKYYGGFCQWARYVGVSFAV